MLSDSLLKNVFINFYIVCKFFRCEDNTFFVNFAAERGKI